MHFCFVLLFVGFVFDPCGSLFVFGLLTGVGLLFCVVGQCGPVQFSLDVPALVLEQRCKEPRCTV